MEVVAPRVTVVILSHRLELLPDAIRSVKEQTYYKKNPGAVQILVQHCEDYWYGKLNEIASIAAGEWLIILCDDDMLAPTYIEECMRVVAVADQLPDMIYTDRQPWKDTGKWQWWNPFTWLRERPGRGKHFHNWGPGYTLETLEKVAKETGKPNKGYFWTPVPWTHFGTGHWLPMTCMIRYGFWREQRGYNNSLNHADTEFWFRAALAKARMAYIPRDLFWYRFHKNQFSNEVPSLESAMREFSRVHFRHFGLMWEYAVEVEPDIFSVPMVPEHVRELTIDQLRQPDREMESAA